MGTVLPAAETIDLALVQAEAPSAALPADPATSAEASAVAVAVSAEPLPDAPPPIETASSPDSAIAEPPLAAATTETGATAPSVETSTKMPEVVHAAIAVDIEGAAGDPPAPALVVEPECATVVAGPMSPAHPLSVEAVPALVVAAQPANVAPAALASPPVEGIPAPAVPAASDNGVGQGETEPWPQQPTEFAAGRQADPSWPKPASSHARPHTPLLEIVARTSTALLGVCKRAKARSDNRYLESCRVSSVWRNQAATISGFFSDSSAASSWAGRGALK